MLVLRRATASRHGAKLCGIWCIAYVSRDKTGAPWRGSAMQASHTGVRTSAIRAIETA